MSGGEERWVISYADMVTLLFALFTALYALGVQDKAKASMMSASIQEALDRPLSQKVIYQPPSVIVPATNATAPASQSFMNSKSKCVGGPGAGGMIDPKVQEQTQSMTDDLESLADDPELSSKLEVEQLNEREVLVRLSSAGFFDPGDSEPNQEALRSLEALARKVRSYKAVETRVEGHTDNIPIAGGRYPSNWELSSARASAVVRALVEHAGMDPTRMTAVGYGQYRPIADNSTIEGRKANRRIDIMIRQPPPAEEAQWGQGRGSKSRSLKKGSGNKEKSILQDRGGAPVDQSEDDTSLDPDQFIESFGLHSDVNERKRPVSAGSPDTRLAPRPRAAPKKTIQEAVGGH